VLYTFCSMQDCKDGAVPRTLLAANEGNFVGATEWGGNCKEGCGTIFQLTPQGSETVLYAFCGQANCADGEDPVSLISDGAGDFYGTTLSGGTPLNGICTDGCGTVFKLTANGTESVLYSFCSQPNCTDGFYPFGLTMDGKGNLYGTTAYGGGGGCVQIYPFGCGTVFKLSADGTETLIHVFTGGADGAVPNGGLIFDDAGNLYGSTEAGGGTDCNDYGCGTVFKLAPDGTETILYSFTGGSDGSSPTGLLAAKNGNFLGTTDTGGDFGCTAFPSGCGTVFKLSPDNKVTVLHAFKGPKTDGAGPGGLISDSAGNLYGITNVGGRHSGCFYKRQGCGTVFELTKK